MNLKKAFRLSLSYMKFRKWHSMLIVLILMLSIAGFTTINQVLTLYSRANIVVVEQKEGKGDLTIKYTPLALEEELADETGVAESASEWIVGTSVEEYPLLLLYRDQNYNDLSPTPLPLQNGNQPVEEKEIVVSNKYAKLNKLNIGDTLPLQYESIDFSTGESKGTSQKEFIIVDLLEDAHISETSDTGLALVSQAFKNNEANYAHINDTVIVLRDVQQTEKFASQIISKYDIDSKHMFINYNLIHAKEDAETMSGMGQAIAIIIIVVFALAIYSILYFEFSSKTKDYAIMRCIGVPASFICITIALQALLFSIVAFALAILLSYLVNLVVGNMIVQSLGLTSAQILKLDTTISLSIIVQALTLGICTVLPSVIQPILSVFRISPIQGVGQGEAPIVSRRSKTKVKKVRSRRFRSKISDFTYKNVLRHKKRLFITMLTIALCGGMIGGIIGKSGTEKVNTDWIRRFNPGDFLITCSRDLIGEDEHKMFSKEYVDYVSGLPQVKDIVTTQYQTLAYTMPMEKLNTDSKLFKEKEADAFTANERDGNYLNHSMVYAVDRLDDYGDINHVNGAIVTKDFSELYHLQLNDAIPFSLQEEEKTVHVPIVAIVDELPLSTRITSAVSVIVDKSTMKELSKIDGVNRMDVWLDDPLNAMLFNEQVMENPESEKYVISSFQDEASLYGEEQKRNEKTTFILVLFLLVVALVVCFNSIVASFLNREQETALLYVIGIDKKSIRKSYFLEGISYTLSGVFVSLIIQAIFGFAFSQSTQGLAVYFLLIILIDILLFLFTSIVTWRQGHKLTKVISLQDI